MISYSKIFVDSFRLAIFHKQLWLLGLFLASGFNLHYWYALQWLNRSGWGGVVRQVILKYDWYFVLLIGAILILIVLGINFIKLLFFGYVHNQLHNVKSGECLLCIQAKDQTIFKILITFPNLLWRTFLASLVTVLITFALVSLFHFYSLHSEFSVAKSASMIASLILILILISWWNLLVALYIFWHQQSFAKAAILAIEFIVRKVKTILAITTLITSIFIVALALVSLVVMQIPNLLTGLPSLVFTSEVAQVWQLVAIAISGLLFLAWLIISNIWFNTVMIMVFDKFAKSKKTELWQAYQGRQPSHATPIHHSIDKGVKI